MPMLTRRSSPFFAALVVAMTAGPLSAVSAQEVIDPLADDETVDVFATGQDAVDRLGDDVADELVARLESDPALAVDRNGELLYLEPLSTSPDTEDADEDAGGDEDGDEPDPADDEDEPEAEPGNTVQGPEATAGAVAEVFALASRPGALRTVLLDVDGHQTAQTRWNAAFDSAVVGNGAVERGAIASGPYDLDGDPTTWSESEVASIQEIWAAVAEHLTPWDVNVILADPSDPADLTSDGGPDARWGLRVVISPDDWSDCGCGGLTYIDAFGHQDDEPAFVHEISPTAVAAAVIDTVGHSLGLDDEGQLVDLLEDDDEDPDLPARPDDHGGTTNPTPLNGPTPTTAGIIGVPGDVDAFEFTTTGGPTVLSVAARPTGSTLDVELVVLDEDGQLVVEDESIDGAAITVEAELSSGTYLAVVSGVEDVALLLDPAAAEEPAASTGSYELTGTIDGAPAADVDPPAAPVGLIGLAFDGIVVLGWSPGDDVDLNRFVILWSPESGGTTIDVASVPAERNGHEDLAPRPGVGYYSVVSVDAVGNRSEPSDEVEVVVPPPVVVEPFDPVISTDEPDDADVGAEPSGLEETDAPDLGDALTEPDADEPDTDDSLTDETEADEPEADEPEADEAKDDDSTEEEPQRELEEEPEQETFVYGDIGGDVDDIAEADGVGQRITETLSGGAESARHDRLEHRWSIEPADGNQELWVVAEAGEDAGDADDGFVLAWSIDRIEWTDLVTLFPGESIDETFDIGAPDDTVYVRVIDTDRTPRQQSPDSIFVDALRVVGDGRPVEPEPEATEAATEVSFHYQGLGEGERAVVVTAVVRDDRGEPVAGAVVEVEVQGDITETVTITTGRDGQGEEQTEGAALRPEVEVCIDAVEVEGLSTQSSPDDCTAPTEPDTENEAENEADEIDDPIDDAVDADTADTDDDAEDDTAGIVEDEDTVEDEDAAADGDEADATDEPVEEETPTAGIE